MVKKIAILLGFIIFLGTLLQVHATDFTSPSFKVKDPVIKSGGGFSTSSAYRLWSSFGQEAIGLSSSSSILKGGFLYFPALVTTTTTGGGTPPPVVSGGGSPLSLSNPLAKKTPEIINRCDFNNDGTCDIVDFSIMLFYFDRPERYIVRYDLNNDGHIDIVDISVLFYYWA